MNIQNNKTYQSLQYEEKRLINKLLTATDLICMYEYGSTVYKSNTPDSDVDLILVIHTSSMFRSIEYPNEVFGILRKFNAEFINTDNYEIYDGQMQFKYHNLSLNIYTDNAWQNKSNSLSIDTLECHFNKDGIFKQDKEYITNIDKIQLRKSISATVSNSWVKGKKKILQGDDRIGYKSIFHAIRILKFGIQIYQYNCIKYFDEPTIEYYNLIVGRYNRYKNEGLSGIDLYNAIICDPKFPETFNLKKEMNNLKSFFKLFTDDEWRKLKQINNDKQ